MAAEPSNLGMALMGSSPLFRTLVLPIIAVVVVAITIISTTAYGLYVRDLDRSFKAQLASEAAALAIGRPEAEMLAADNPGLSGARVTLIAAHGVALFDSYNDLDSLGSLLDRPEVLRATSHGSGEATRVNRQGELLHYAAQAIVVGDNIVGYARVARPASELRERAASVRNLLALLAVLMTVVGVLVVGLVIAWHVVAVRRILGVSDCLLKGEYSNRLPIHREDELGYLSRRLNELSSDTVGRIEQEQQISRRLAAILAGLNEGVVAVDDEQRVIHINAAAYQMLNEVDRSGTGMPFWEVVRVSEVIGAVDEACSKQSTARLQADIHGRQYDVSVIALRDGELEGVGAIVVLQDVTDLIHLEQVRTEFVANASHELKTPIAAIKGFVETIIDDPEMPDLIRDRFMRRLRVQAGRIENLVQELIALSRYDAARETLPLAPVDLAYVVRQAYQNKQEDAESASVMLEYEGPTRSLEVQGDNEALAQLVVNLIDNGIKYVDTGGHVKVRLFDLGRHAVLEVEDNGIGIAAGEQERVFERFYRVDKARSAEKGGTGLGLAIVKHIAHAHQGTVVVESAPDRGSLFSVRLPLIGESLGLPK